MGMRLNIGSRFAILQQETQDQLFVQWSKDTEFAGKAATLHVLVIHAMIVLLTYGEPQG